MAAALSAREQERFVRRWAMAPGLFDARALGVERVRHAVRQRIAWGHALLNAGDYKRFLFHAHTADRLPVFARLAPLLTDADYWRLLSKSYVSCGMTAWRYPDLVRRLLTAARAGREHFMDDDDRLALAALPEPLSIYRGAALFTGAAGWSWTPDVIIARYYALHSRANRISQNRASGLLIHGTVGRSNIVGYLVGGSEAEVVCDPACVAIASVEVLRCPGPPVESLTDEVLANGCRRRFDGVPGITDELLYVMACERELVRRCRERESL